MEKATVAQLVFVQKIGRYFVREADRCDRTRHDTKCQKGKGYYAVRRVNDDSGRIWHSCGQHLANVADAAQAAT